MKQRSAYKVIQQLMCLSLSSPCLLSHSECIFKSLATSVFHVLQDITAIGALARQSNTCASLEHVTATEARLQKMPSDSRCRERFCMQSLSDLELMWRCSALWYSAVARCGIAL